jgi:hypothetical protein
MQSTKDSSSERVEILGINAGGFGERQISTTCDAWVFCVPIG